MRTVTNNFWCMEGETYDEKAYVDIEGKIVNRNPMEYPYSYNPFVIYKSNDYKNTDTPYYYDRILSKFKKEDINNALDKIGLKMYGPEMIRMSWKNPYHVEQFVSILFKRTVKCTAIMEGCKFFDGYKYWIVYIQ